MKHLVVAVGVMLAAISSNSIAQLAPGDLLPATPGTTIDGWTVEGRGSDLDNEFYITLKKGRAYQLAWIDPLGNVAQGTDGKVQVLAAETAALLKNEVPVPGAGCRKGEQQPIMAFYNVRTGMARGYFIEDEAIVMKRWKTRRAQCRAMGS